MISFGIDFGTSFSSIACLHTNGKLECIPSSCGELQIPSAVLFSKDSYIVGQLAINAAFLSPEHVVQEVKRHIGDFGWLWEYGGDFYRPEDISAIIIKKLCQDAKSYTGQDVSHAVITVPAHFNELQRTSIIEAGKLAGIKHIYLLNEPTAAAITYGYMNILEKSKIFVFDLGGGTFDITILELSDNQLLVKASNGHGMIGGQNWDDLIIHHIAVQFISEYGIDPLDDPKAYQNIKTQVIQAKHLLSFQNQTSIFIKHNGFDMKFNINREIIEKLSQEYLFQIKQICIDTLGQLQLAPTDINYVYLVGGATRMPIIQNLVKHLFSNANIIQEYPEQAVVYGATIHAATLNNTQNISQIIFPPENPNIYLTIENNLDLSNNSHINQKHQVSFLGGHTLSNPSSYSSNYLLTKDIATHRLGIIVLNSQGQKFVDTVIPRYTPLPYTTHEYYYTAYDNQISIELEIVEGESPYPEDCVYLGYAHITDIPPRPAGQRINIAFTYDINNILQINLLDIGSGQRQNILLQRPQSNYHHIKQTILTRQIK